MPGNGKVALVGIVRRRSQVISSMEFSVSKHSVPVAAVKLPSPKLNPIEFVRHFVPALPGIDVASRDDWAEK